MTSLKSSTSLLALFALLLALAACEGARDKARARQEAGRNPQVTISGEEAVLVPAWQPPAVEIASGEEPKVLAEAKKALDEDRLFGGERDAVPLLLELRARMPDDPEVARMQARAVKQLIVQGDAALEDMDMDPDALRRAHEIGEVARTAAGDDPAVRAFLSRVDGADQSVKLDVLGEREFAAGRMGGEKEGEGALAYFREAMRGRPGDARAAQGIAAVESNMIRHAEDAAARADFGESDRWLAIAGKVRPGADTVADARQRIAMVRRLRVDALRDEGVAALMREGGLPQARRVLSEMLRIAAPGDPAASELRERIDLVAHYGLFRPGQVFTDALRSGARGPQMVVVPHGGFLMGARDGETDGRPAERPSHYVRFDRGFAMARTETTVGEFRRFIDATQYRSRAVRRGHSIVYDESSGNLVRRSNVDWRHTYTGALATDDMPVLHVSARDAEAYAHWLSQQTGERYALPSEAQFEYAVRAGTVGPLPWESRIPPRSAGNVTGGLDRSPTGRQWHNAFAGYGDGYWGPAPAGAFAPNAFGLHDLAGNVSEWVADCWHEGYRRAPTDGQPWVNPGCRQRVIRGGSWLSAPAQVRSAWRLSTDGDTTNARLGFRLVREL
ncbi:formylglycine-generating enzyme family protein [Lysobacter sp. KIS68-7]|uniref:formylglycine-generating enzyme family protein n=1 Tax=Lysobacter sp. KIS68-7 TaxID=2904252 RepID=UPI001E42C98C|nr:formylglycine-generating enzyme family protein [Lysobacter sp. KIS68-7]UHQ18473.1 formylglycine-generating enzyme family protein [Lysobacter sp. KIS68-7]